MREKLRGKKMEEVYENKTTEQASAPNDLPGFLLIHWLFILPAVFS